MQCVIGYPSSPSLANKNRVEYSYRDSSTDSCY